MITWSGFLGLASRQVESVGFLPLSLFLVGVSIGIERILSIMEAKAKKVRGQGGGPDFEEQSATEGHGNRRFGGLHRQGVDYGQDANLR